MENVLQQGSSAVLATIIDGPAAIGAKLLMISGGESVGSLGDVALEATVSEIAARFLTMRDEARTFRVHEFAPALGSWADAKILLAGNFGYAILATAALSYLGLGTQPPVSDWGVLMSQGYDHMFQAASEVIFPGAAIVLTVLGLNLLADGLTDAFGSRG